MRASQFFISTLKEAPAEAELVSHKLMLRAGAGPPERAEGRQWLETAHARGSATAARRLAKLSVAEDPAAALALWRVSAEVRLVEYSLVGASARPSAALGRAH